MQAVDYTQGDQFTKIQRKFVLGFPCQEIGDVLFHVKLFIFLSFHIFSLVVVRRLTSEFS